MKTLFRVLNLLERSGVPNALIGGFALNLTGVSRSTLDIDLFVVEEACLGSAFWQDLQVEGFSVARHRGDFLDPLAGVVRVRARRGRPVDVVVGRLRWQRRAIDRAVALPLQGREARVLQRVDLVLMKLYAGGPQDAWDIEQLLALGDRDGLAAEVDRDIDDLPRAAIELWHRIKTTLPRP